MASTLLLLSCTCFLLSIVFAREVAFSAASSDCADDGQVNEDDIRRQQEAARRADSQLCRQCLKVELRPEKLSRLGSFKDVCVRTSCPLCRITIAAITNIRRLIYPQTYEPPFGIDPSEEVQLYWHSRLGFSVNLAIPDCHISFVQEEGEYGDDLDTEVPLRRARRIQSEPYDDSFSDWLSSCQEHHGDACNPATSQVAPFFEQSFLAGMSYAFRLVNVDSWCIVEARSKASGFDENDNHYNYIALSYVWGQVACLKLCRHNQEELMKPRSLERHWHEIPQTIKDAIHLVRQMGFRYLWVDALCLVQDNELDMLQGIHHMDLVYNGAVLTFIAAAGPNANAGLLGVRRGSRRLEQPIEEIKEGVQVTVVESLDNLLNASSYSSRAWTLQEQLLANRTLIFTPNGGVYFRCLRAVWSLDTIDDEYPSIVNYKPSSLYMALDPQHKTHAIQYNSLVMELTRRDLTNQSDALSVFSGLENVLSESMTCSFLAGLPTAAFDFFILFDGQSVTLERRHWFPSWSWAGWKGCAILYMLPSMFYPSDLAACSQTRTWIVWFQRKGDEPRSLVAGSEGNIKISSANQGHNWTERRFDNRHCPLIDTSQTEPIKPLLKNLPYSMQTHQLLQFWTLSIYLTISSIESPDGERNVRERGTIVDRDNVFCGSVRLDGYYITEADLNKPVEFIILSECKDTMAGSEINERDGLSAIRKIWDLYWVMLIQWDEDGIIAERRGLGQVYQKAVGTSVAPGPSWKEIILG